MPMSLRRFLACLLFVALPWQGVAAAAMVLCGPATPVAAADKGAHDGAAMHPASGADHAMHHGHGDAHDALHAHEGSVDRGHGLQADAGHHCSACSLCGHALALPGTPVNLQSSLPSQGPVAGVGLRPDSRVAALPDKPPRA